MIYHILTKFYKTDVSWCFHLPGRQLKAAALSCNTLCKLFVICSHPLFSLISRGRRFEFCIWFLTPPHKLGWFSLSLWERWTRASGLGPLDRLITSSTNFIPPSARCCNTLSHTSYNHIFNCLWNCNICTTYLLLLVTALLSMYNARDALFLFNWISIFHDCTMYIGLTFIFFPAVSFIFLNSS